MEQVTINDELIIKIDCVTIVHKHSEEYSDTFKLSVIHLFSDNETYLCYVPLNHLYKFKGQFKIDKKFADVILLDSKFINEYAVIIHNNNIYKIIKDIFSNGRRSACRPNYIRHLSGLASFLGAVWPSTAKPDSWYIFRRLLYIAHRTDQWSTMS